jgi:hypothetical protein
VNNENNVDIADNYLKQFKIKTYQGRKNPRFEIDKIKKGKYGKRKSLLYLSAVCHSLMAFLGHFVTFAKKLLTSLGTCTSLLKFEITTILPLPGRVSGDFFSPPILCRWTGMPDSIQGAKDYSISSF